MSYRRDDERERGWQGERGDESHGSRDRAGYGRTGGGPPRPGAWPERESRPERWSSSEAWRGEDEWAPWGTSEGSEADRGGSGYGERPGYGGGSGGSGYRASRSAPFGGGGERPFGGSSWERGGTWGREAGRGSATWGRDAGGGSGSGWPEGPGEASLGGRYTGRGPKGYQRSRERILDDVCERLADHPEVDASEMEVDVQGDVVHLRGRAHDRGQKRLAEDVAESVSGVRDVRNELDVERGMLATLTDAVTGRSDEEPGDTHAAPRKASAGTTT